MLEWSTRVEALTFCPNSDEIQYTQDIGKVGNLNCNPLASARKFQLYEVDNQQFEVSMQYFSTGARPDYRSFDNRLQRFVFGGSNTPDKTHFIIEKGFDGNDQKLRLTDVQALFDDYETAKKWTIPTTVTNLNGREYNETGKRKVFRVT